MEIKKYFTKRVLVMGLVVLSAVAMYSTINLRSKLLLTRSELSSSRMMNTIVEGEKNRLDSLARVHLQSIKERDSLIAVKDRKITEQSKNLAILQDSVEKVLANVVNITPDSSYAYIDRRVPATSERVYPFDSTQVKKIHYTFLERDGLFKINSGLKVYTSDLLQLSSIKDNQIVELKSLNNVYLRKESIMLKETEAYKIEIVGLNKNVKQQKFLKNVAIGGIGVALILPPVLKILTK